MQNSKRQNYFPFRVSWSYFKEINTITEMINIKNSLISIHINWNKGF
jgi:hypothetical protein